MQQWNSSIDCTNFWKERERAKTIVEAQYSCSQFVNDIIAQETPATATSAYSSCNSSTVHPTAETVRSDSRQHFVEARYESGSETPVLPYSDDSNVALNTPWLVNNKDINELFYEYKRHVQAKEQLFKLETDMQDILALSDILFLARDHHSPLKARIFGLETRDGLCSQMDDYYMDMDADGNNTLNDTEFTAITRVICA